MLQGGGHHAPRQPTFWSENLAVGSEAFVEGVNARLGIGRDHGYGIAHSLKEPEMAQGGYFGPTKGTPSDNNAPSVD